MMDADIRKFIVDEIKKQVHIITSGAAGATTKNTETIDSLYPGMSSFPDRPVSQPYGFVSRAPKGTISVTAQQGEHPGNKLTLGHRDKNAPDISEGESRMYSLGGYNIAVKNGEIFVGKGEDLEHMVVGETLKEFLIALIGYIVVHQHLGNLGYNTGVPLNAGDFTTLQGDFLDNDKILAKDGGRF